MNRNRSPKSSTQCPAVWPGVGIARNAGGQRSTGSLPSRQLSASGWECELGPVDDAPAAEVLGVAAGVGHVVAMRQKDVRDAPERLQAADQAAAGTLGESISQLPAGCRMK